MSKQFNPSQTNIILIIVSLVVVFLVGQYYNPEPEYSRKNFYLVFGEEPADSVVAQIAVDYQLNNLTEQICQMDYLLHVAQLGNDSLEIIYQLNLKKIANQINLAKHFWFSVPEEAEKLTIEPLGRKKIKYPALKLRKAGLF